MKNEETINEQVKRIMRNQLISELITINGEINDIHRGTVIFDKFQVKLRRLKAMQKNVIDELKGL